jgi:hypothetical protein
VLPIARGAPRDDVRFAGLAYLWGWKLIAEGAPLLRDYASMFGRGCRKSEGDSVVSDYWSCIGFEFSAFTFNFALLSFHVVVFI